MRIEQQTFIEWEQRFTPCGVGRFVEAAFLAVWLCGWAVGEILALTFLGAGLFTLVTGRPALGSAQPVTLGPALGIGGFLLVWLAFWTLGGVMAIRELLRAVWAEDHLALGHGGLRLSRRLGPFRSIRHLAREKLRRIFIQPRGATLMAETDSLLVELTNLGSVAERTAAAHHLRLALKLADADSAIVPEAAPEGWDEVFLPRDGFALVPNLRTRRQQALVMSVIAGAASVGTLLLVRASAQDVNLWALTAMAATATTGLGWSAWWLWQGRKEWLMDRGRLVFQKRFGSRVTVLGEARSLEVTERKDGDGDCWYELVAVGTASPKALAGGGASDLGRQTGTAGGRFTITQAMHDPSEPRRLGLWLSRRASVPLTDRVPDEAARRAEEARLLEALARSGRLGRFVAQWANRAVPPGQSG
jgi:hypothetical protein